jgi:hypothetical protein
MSVTAAARAPPLPTGTGDAAPDERRPDYQDRKPKLAVVYAVVLR